MLDKYKPYAPIVVRITLSLVFLWFGFNQIFDTSSWLGWLPSWTSSLPIPSFWIIFINGIFEVVLGLLLLVGKWTQLASLLLSIHLFFIALNVGYNDIAIRDLGLSLATFSVFLHGPDAWCWENTNNQF